MKTIIYVNIHIYICEYIHIYVLIIYIHELERTTRFPKIWGPLWGRLVALAWSLLHREELQ